MASSTVWAWRSGRRSVRSLQRRLLGFVVILCQWIGRFRVLRNNPARQSARVPAHRSTLQDGNSAGINAMFGQNAFPFFGEVLHCLYLLGIVLAGGIYLTRVAPGFVQLFFALDGLIFKSRITSGRLF